jgi:hypothetical protein
MSKLIGMVVAGTFLALSSVANAQQAELVDRSSGAMKVCSVFVPNMWRDTFPVPTSWSGADCIAMGREMGANSYQLGCLHTGASPNRYSLGAVGGASPARNCGW